MKSGVIVATCVIASVMAATGTSLRADDKPVASTPAPSVPVPTESLPQGTLQQQALDEKAKGAVKEATKSRVYAVGGEINLIGNPPQLHPVPPSLVTAFCRDSSNSRFAIVRVRYEWRPNDGYVPDALLIVRRSGTDIKKRVRLGPGTGYVEVGRATAPLTGLVDLSAADLCPSGCTDARLAQSTATDANRFDQQWTRVCLRR